MFTNSCLRALNNKALAMGIFIDFSKAFSTVNHAILFQKLCHYGVNFKVLNWFKSYLTDRQQCVKLDKVI